MINEMYLVIGACFRTLAVNLVSDCFLFFKVSNCILISCQHLRMVKLRHNQTHILKFTLLCEDTINFHLYMKQIKNILKNKEGTLSQ